MRLTVRYFASIREALGAAEAFEMPAGSSVADIRDALIALDEPHAHALARGKALRSALNQVLCSETAIVPDGAELAFFPPVTGG